MFLRGSGGRSKTEPGRLPSIANDILLFIIIHCLYTKCNYNANTVIGALAPKIN